MHWRIVTKIEFVSLYILGYIEAHILRKFTMSETDYSTGAGAGRPFHLTTGA